MRHVRSLGPTLPDSKTMLSISPAFTFPRHETEASKPKATPRKTMLMATLPSHC